MPSSWNLAIILSISIFLRSSSRRIAYSSRAAATFWIEIGYYYLAITYLSFSQASPQLYSPARDCLFWNPSRQAKAISSIQHSHPPNCSYHPQAPAWIFLLLPSSREANPHRFLFYYNAHIGYFPSRIRKIVHFSIISPLPHRCSPFLWGYS